MKVKFLKNGRWAHSDLQLGQFNYKVDETIDGISENDANKMVAANIGEIVEVPITETKQKHQEIKEVFAPKKKTFGKK